MSREESQPCNRVHDDVLPIKRATDGRNEKEGRVLRGFRIRALKQTRKQSAVITGSKPGTRIKAVARKVGIFMARFDPNVAVEGLKKYVLELTNWTATLKSWSKGSELCLFYYLL